MNRDLVRKVLEEVTGLESDGFFHHERGRDDSGVSVFVPSNMRNRGRFWREIRSRLDMTSHVMFWGRDYSLHPDPILGRNNGLELVVAPGSSQFDILHVSKFLLIYNDMTVDDLLRYLKRWHKRLGVEIVQSYVSLTFSLLSLEDDLRWFVDDVYKVCPFVIEPEEVYDAGEDDGFLVRPNTIFEKVLREDMFVELQW